MTSKRASRPSWMVKVKAWCLVPRNRATSAAALLSGAPGRPIEKLLSCDRTGTECRR